MTVIVTAKLALHEMRRVAFRKESEGLIPANTAEAVLVQVDRDIAAGQIRVVEMDIRIEAEFNAIVPQQFDIVYLDLCGPLFGGNPNTIHTLRELFVNQRLAPLSVLITNFSEPVPKSDGLGDLIGIARLLSQNPSLKQTPFATAVGNMLDEESASTENNRKWGKLLALWILAYSDDETRSEYQSQFASSLSDLRTRIKSDALRFDMTRFDFR